MHLGELIQQYVFSNQNFLIAFLSKIMFHDQFYYNPNKLIVRIVCVYLNFSMFEIARDASSANPNIYLYSLSR